MNNEKLVEEQNELLKKIIEQLKAIDDTIFLVGREYLGDK
jgi:hypothetical protein